VSHYAKHATLHTVLACADVCTCENTTICSLWEQQTRRAKLQTKHNKGLAYGKGEPARSKQPKKDIVLRQVDDAHYEVELGVFT
jgi:hypothetical protein